MELEGITPVSDRMVLSIAVNVAGVPYLTNYS